MKLSLILAPLIAAKVDHALIMDTILAFEAQQTDALEKRRESDRNRQAAKRERDACHVKSRDVTVTVPSHAGVTRVEDITSNLEPTGQIKTKKLLVHSHPERDFFAEFWLAYPRREGPNPKKPAKLAFDRLVAKGAAPERIIDGARQLALEHPTPTRFVPQAVTWLNQERFDDAEPVLTGDEFCPADWFPTKFLVTRFRRERQRDPPDAIHGGRAGFMLPAEWVAIAKQGQATDGARLEN